MQGLLCLYVGCGPGVVGPVFSKRAGLAADGRLPSFVCPIIGPSGRVLPEKVVTTPEPSCPKNRYAQQPRSFCQVIVWNGRSC